MGEMDLSGGHVDAVDSSQVCAQESAQNLGCEWKLILAFINREYHYSCGAGENKENMP